jgi:hypothetical protein
VGIERGALLGGAEFLEMTASGDVDPRTLVGWFEEHLVATGSMSRPLLFFEPSTSGVAIRPANGIRPSSPMLGCLVATARGRVVDRLRGFIASPSSDEFLQAAIHLGRVRRVKSRWVASPEVMAPLSGVVLSLFAVAILTDRSACERALCVCQICGRVSFDPRSEARTSCPLHTVRGSRFKVKAR